MLRKTLTKHLERVNHVLRRLVHHVGLIEIETRVYIYISVIQIQFICMNNLRGTLFVLLFFPRYFYPFAQRAIETVIQGGH